MSLVLSFCSGKCIVSTHALHESVIVRVDDFTSKVTAGKHSICPLEDVAQVTGLTQTEVVI